MVDAENHLFGIFTDGDLRRAFNQSIDLKQITVGEIAHQNCIATRADELGINVVNLMQDKQITVLPVTDESNKVMGIIHMHDLLKAGIV